MRATEGRGPCESAIGMSAPDASHPYRRPSPTDDDEGPPRSGSMRAVTFFGALLIAGIGAAVVIPLVREAWAGSAREDASAALGPWLEDEATRSLLERADPRERGMPLVDRPTSGYETDERGHIAELERAGAGVGPEARGAVVRLGRTPAIDGAHVAMTEARRARQGEDVDWIAVVRRSRERGAYSYAAASVDVERVIVHVVDGHGATIGTATIEALPPPHTGVPPAYVPLDDELIAGAIELLLRR